MKNERGLGIVNRLAVSRFRIVASSAVSPDSACVCREFRRRRGRCVKVRDAEKGNRHAYSHPRFLAAALHLECHFVLRRFRNRLSVHR